MVTPMFHTSKECHKRRTNAKKYVVSRTKAIRRLLARTSTRHVHTVRGHYENTPRAMSTKTAERRTKTQNKIKKIHVKFTTTNWAFANCRFAPECVRCFCDRQSPPQREFTDVVGTGSAMHLSREFHPSCRHAANATIVTFSSARRPMCRFRSRSWSHGGARTLSQHTRESGSKKEKERTQNNGNAGGVITG